MSGSERPDHDPQPDVSPQDRPERKFGWWDMFVDPDNDPREEGGDLVGERATLAGYLRAKRLTLELKCSGLDAAAIARSATPTWSRTPTAMTAARSRSEKYWCT